MKAVPGRAGILRVFMSCFSLRLWMKERPADQQRINYTTTGQLNQIDLITNYFPESGIIALMLLGLNIGASSVKADFPDGRARIFAAAESRPAAIAGEFFSRPRRREGRADGTERGAR